MYTYLPQLERNKERLLVVPPKSIQHPDYGFSVGRGAFRLVPGRWIRVTQRVKMNDLFKENGMSGVHIDSLCDSQRSLSGEIEIYIDGQSVLHATGLVLRSEEGPDGRVQGLHIQTFFGGMPIFRLHEKLS